MKCANKWTGLNMCSGHCIFFLPKGFYGYQELLIFCIPLFLQGVVCALQPGAKAFYFWRYLEIKGSIYLQFQYYCVFTLKKITAWMEHDQVEKNAALCLCFVGVNLRCNVHSLTNFYKTFNDINHSNDIRLQLFWFNMFIFYSPESSVWTLIILSVRKCSKV